MADGILGIKKHPFLKDVRWECVLHNKEGAPPPPFVPKVPPAPRHGMRSQHPPQR